MDSNIIQNWNRFVKPNDIVFDLGDFAFASNGRWKELLNQLNGYHYLILGNHDRSRYPGEKTMKLFDGVSEQMTLIIDDQKIYLNHYPYLCLDGTYKKDNQPWQLFGHVHLNVFKDKNTGKDFERLKLLFPNQYDVGVDFNYYRPISFLELKSKIEYQIQNNVNCLTWIQW